MRPSLRTVLLLLPCLGCTAVGRAQEPATKDTQKTLAHRDGGLLVVEPAEADHELRMTPVVRAVQRTADSVVSVYLQAEHALANGGPVTEAQGSGVILDESGLVITNWHVVAPALLDARQSGLDFAVKLRDGRTRRAQVLSSSSTRDLALLQLQLDNGETVKPAEIGRTADLMIGETVIAIGNPQGQANTVTSGVLSAIDRTIQVRTPDGRVRSYSDLLQTDAAINQGNSGGALLDITGRLIGINNAMAMGAENIGFAIPMDVVRQVFEKELTQSSSFAQTSDAPWLGLEVAERDGSVVVTEVAQGSPAALVGVRSGDVLVAVDSQPLRTPIDYLRRTLAKGAGKPLPLSLRRGKDELSLEPVPVTHGNATSFVAVGAEVEEVSLEQDPTLVRKTTTAFYRGSMARRVPLFPAVLRVTRVLPDSPADSVGLRAGDVLLAVFANTRYGERDLPMTSLNDWSTVLQQQRGRGLKFAILRGDDDLQGTLDVRGEAN